MPLLRKGEFLPSKGISRAIPAQYLADGYHFPQNMRYEAGELMKVDGKKKLGGLSLGGQKILHHGVLETSDLIQYLFRHTKQNVQYYNSASGQWVDITGIDLTGSESNFFSSCVLTESNLYLFTNFHNNIRLIRATLGASDDLSGAAGLFKAKFLEYLTPYVLAAYTEESGTAIPTKVRWCDTNAPTVWNSGNAGSKLLTHEPSAIRGMKKLGNKVFVYKEKSSYSGRPVSTSDTFLFDPFEFGRGLYAPRGLVDRGDAHLYMGLDDFHINTGVRIQDIGAPVREYLFPRLNRDKSETCFALNVPKYKEVWFFVTVSGNDWPTEIWKYKWDLDFWYFDTCRSLTTAELFKNVAVIAWDDAVGTWDEQIATWDQIGGQSSSPLITYGRNDGYSLIQDLTGVDDDGVAVTAQVETRDYVAAALESKLYTGQQQLLQEVRWLQADFEGSGNQVKFYYSLDEGLNWTFVGTIENLSINQVNTFWFDVVAPKIRFKFVADGAMKFFRVRAFQPFYLDQAGNFGKIAP